MMVISALAIRANRTGGAVQRPSPRMDNKYNRVNVAAARIPNPCQAPARPQRGPAAAAAELSGALALHLVAIAFDLGAAAGRALCAGAVCHPTVQSRHGRPALHEHHLPD